MPLDPRHTYTKADWELWTAAWLHEHTEIRDLLIDTVYLYVDTTSTRVPFSDWYDTTTAKQSGFQARPVVGGMFALLTLDGESITWQPCRQQTSSTISRSPCVLPMPPTR